MEIKRGRLFVIEGPDGAGKATQTRLLSKRLIAEGYDVDKLEFPQYGKNVFADTVTAYLSGGFGNPINVNPYLASLPYSGDRFKASFQIRKSLAEGIIVLTDRYTSANMGHQGAKIKDTRERVNYIEWLKQLEFGENGFHIPKPDLTVLLYVPPSVSEKLIHSRHHVTGREKDGHETDRDYVQRVAETFLQVAHSDPTWRVINCINKKGELLKEANIQDKIWKVINPYLPPK